MFRRNHRAQAPAGFHPCVIPSRSSRNLRPGRTSSHCAFNLPPIEPPGLAPRRDLNPRPPDSKKPPAQVVTFCLLPSGDAIADPFHFFAMALPPGNRYPIRAPSHLYLSPFDDFPTQMALTKRGPNVFVGYEVPLAPQSACNFGSDRAALHRSSAAASASFFAPWRFASVRSTRVRLWDEHRNP
jgi:hypothetical protein